MCDEKPLSSSCRIETVCIIQRKCAHNPDRPMLCRYNDMGLVCRSEIANVNALVLELKRLTGKDVKLT